MASIKTFNNIAGIDPEVEKKRISFAIFREPLVPKNHFNIDSQYDMVLAKQKNGILKRIDEVPRKRPFIKFQDAHDWINSEFKQIGLDFKLRKSVVEPKKMSLYQEYIFNKDVISPDGQEIAPMVYVKVNHSKIGAPLELNLGTYRFICANGAIVTVGDMTTIKLTELNWNIYTKSVLHKMFIEAFEKYSSVSDLYVRLSRIKASIYFNQLFSNNLLPLRLRKKVIEKLENEKMLRIIKDIRDPSKNKEIIKSKLLSREMLEKPSESIALNYNTMSLWDVYNKFTETVTHENKTSTGIINGSRAVNSVFQSLVNNKENK